MSSVTVTTLGTPTSQDVGKGPPISRTSCDRAMPARLMVISLTRPV